MAAHKRREPRREPRSVEETLRKLEAHPRARPMTPDERVEPGVTLVTFIPGPDSRRRQE